MGIMRTAEDKRPFSRTFCRHRLFDNFVNLVLIQTRRILRALDYSESLLMRRRRASTCAKGRAAYSSAISVSHLRTLAQALQPSLTQTSKIPNAMSRNKLFQWLLLADPSAADFTKVCSCSSPGTPPPICVHKQ